MATEAAISSAPPAQVVGNAFVEQYYHILHKSPELVHRFYQDSSSLSRPDLNGVMTTVTTMQGINDKICSFDYKSHTAEIKTADAQASYKDGVIVLVTGCLTGPDNIRRNFTQMFFLAPQDKGYFVLSDVFRYVEDNVPLENIKTTVNGTQCSAFAPPTPEPKPSQVFDPPTVDSSISRMEEVQNAEEFIHDPLENQEYLVNEKEVVVDPEPHSNENQIPDIMESGSPIARGDTPKKSYASIVSSQTKKGGSGPNKVYVPTNTSKAPPKKIEKQSLGSVAHAPVPEASAPSASASASSLESGKDQEEAEGHSIYVRNLPLNVTDDQLEMEFKKFGPIKRGGVQVRSNKLQDLCFGFVEFQSLSSMNDAIQASPIAVGGRKAFVEIKRTTSRVGSGRGRFPSGRGGFRSDSYRGHGNFGGGRGYGRSEFMNRGDFSSRGRGPSGSGGQVYQRGRWRGGPGRQGGSSRNADST